MSQGLWINPSTFVAFDKMKNGSLTNEIATRERSIDFFSLGMYLPNPDPVLKNLGKDISVYEELLCDSQIEANVGSRKAGVLSLNWEIDRKDIDDAGAKKSPQAIFIEEIFSSYDMPQLIEEILDAFWYGYKPLEILWKTVNGKWIPSLVGKPPEWFMFGPKAELRFRSSTNWTGEELPENKFIVATRGASYKNPYGKPVASRCFWPLTFKKGGIKFWLKLAEKAGVPHLIGKYRPGESKANIDALLDAMDKLFQDAVAAIPDTCGIDVLESTQKTASSSLFKDLSTFCNNEISKAILGQTLTTEVGDRGSYAASKTHGEIREDIVDSDKKMVESVFNKLIDITIQFNFGDTAERPRFCMYAPEDIDADLAERDKNISSIGQVKFTKTYFIRKYRFKEDEIDVVAPEQRPAIPPAFADQTVPFDQQAIDDLGSAIDPEDMQDIAQEMLKPVIELVQNAESFDEIKQKLPKLYPSLDSTKLMSLLEKSMFLSDVWGRVNQ